MQDDSTKRCKGCHRVLPLSEFHMIRAKNGKKYPYSYCKPCGKRNRQKWHHTEKGQEAHRKHMFRTNYGITLTQYNVMLKEQNGVCAICGNPETRMNRRGTIRLLSVDHDHASGRRRGLLCSACNSGLGYFKDDCVRLHSAIAYLTSGQSHQAG